MRRNFALTSLLLESSNVRRHETAQHASHRGACHDSFVYQILSLFVQRFDKFSCPCKKTCCVSTFESSDKKFSRGRGISVKLSTGLIFCSFFLLSRRFQISMFFFESIVPLEAWSHQKAPAIFYSRENLLGTRKHRLKSNFALEILANRHGSCEGMESSISPCRSANAQCGQRSGTPLS